MGSMVTDSVKKEPTKEQIIEELNSIAKEFRGSVEFLATVSEKYPEWSDFINAITTWLKLEGSYKEFLLEIIERSAKLRIDANIGWNSIDLNAVSTTYRQTVTEAIKNSGLTIEPKSRKVLILIQQLREYHPVWIKRKAEEEKKKESCSEVVPKKEEPTTGDSKVDWLKVEMRQEEQRSAEVAKGIEEARKRKEERQKKLKELESAANNTIDIKELKRILRELYKYKKEFSMQVDQIRRTIIARIERDKEQERSPQKQNQTSEFEDVKTYILLGLTQGNLDVEQANQRLKKYATTFASQSAKSCRISSLRITPVACQTQVMIAVHDELQKKASDYPIIEGNEACVIQQLISLGISEQSATGAVIENLCFSKRFKNANSIINAYKAKYENIEIGAITDEKERKRIIAQREIMPKVIEKWTRRVLECTREENSTSVILGMSKKEVKGAR